MTLSSKTRVCFILGVDKRSGTNYLFRLLKKHPDCVGPGPIWEDYFLKHSNMLRQYVNLLYNTWNPRWEVKKVLGDQDVLLRYFGEAIEHFLRLQTRANSVNRMEAKKTLTDHELPKTLLSKTPSVENIDGFFDFFPDAYLILLVRDGRAVVESGVRSFDWNYEDSMWRWRNRAQTILNFKEKYEQPKKYIIVRYEDLVERKKETLIKIFNYLNLEPEMFDFKQANSIGITGSSELRKSGGAIHWKSIEKTPDFNPLARFDNWDRKKHERFNWIAGQQMRKFGYELSEFNGNKHLYIFKNKLIDKKFVVLRLLKMAIKALKSWPNRVKGKF